MRKVINVKEKTKNLNPKNKLDKQIIELMQELHDAQVESNAIESEIQDEYAFQLQIKRMMKQTFAPPQKRRR